MPDLHCGALRVLLLTPPMIQLNTPYPATAYLTGFLRQHEARLGLSSDARPIRRSSCSCGCSRARASSGCARARDAAAAARPSRCAVAVGGELRRARRRVRRHRRRRRALSAGARSGAGAAHRRPDRSCPKGRASPRRREADDGDPLAWAFGALGARDRARHLASLYVDDVADVLRDGDRRALRAVALRRAAGGERADVRSAARRRSKGRPRWSTHARRDRRASSSRAHRPGSGRAHACRFPGNVYGAFRMARALKARAPATRIALGGGYVNTELRQLSEPRVFDYVDYVTLDDGERPLLALIEHLADASKPLLRTFVRDGGRVVERTDAGAARRAAARRRHADLPRPAARPLPVARSRCSTRCTGCGRQGAGTS